MHLDQYLLVFAFSVDRQDYPLHEDGLGVIPYDTSEYSLQANLLCDWHDNLTSCHSERD
jgi:hypothetical protein